MLFHLSYRPRPNLDEAGAKRALELFLKWKPPAGSEIKAHYARPDGGGFAVVEANSLAPLIEATAVWEVFFDQEVVPVMDMAEAVPAIQRGIAWRSSGR